MLLTLSLLLSILESMIPIFNGMIPGIKIGLANIILVMVLYLYGAKETFAIALLRVLLMGILRTGLFNIHFFFSLAGTICSVGIMTFAKKTKLSMIGVSILGSIFHSIGQIIIAIYLLHLPNLIYYLPWMILGSMITGAIIGYFAKTVLKQFKNTL